MNPTGPASSARPVFGPATAVLELAVSGRWRAPETTAALADHAAAQARAESDWATALLAEGWLVHGLAAVGRGAAAVPRAVAALGDAVRHGHRPAEARLRVGLASVARELGDGDSARALLDPVLGREISDPELAADAHIEAVRCGGRGAEGLLAAADLAMGHIRRLRGEQVELGLAALDAALANRHRAARSARAAAARAREGLRRLLGDPGSGSDLDPISPHIAAWLNLELTLALLDDGQTDTARRVAEPALTWSGRPAALVPLTRLRLALAQRAYLPVGENEAALRAVGWAAGVVGEQDLPGLEADCQSLLAEVHEQRGALPDALMASRRAHQALRMHSARVEQALVLLGRSAGNARTTSAAVERTAGIAVASGPDRRLTSDLPPTPPSATPPSALPPTAAERSPHPGAAHEGAPASRDAISATGAFAASSPTLRLPMVPPRPAAPGPETPAVSWSTPGTASGPSVDGSGGSSSRRVEEVLTGWPDDAHTDTSQAEGSASPRVTPPVEGDEVSDTVSYRRAPEVSDGVGWAEAGGWNDLSSPTAAMARTPWHEEPEPTDGSRGVEALGREPEYTSMPPVDELGLPVGELGLPGAELGARGDEFDADAEDSGSEANELDELFEPGEDRPLGLVALDVATPTGPLTGDAVRPLLERVAEHVRGQLPPNSRLAVLARDVVLVVLPPVEADVVARWMRSLAGGLSARWNVYASDVPRSAFRVAVGALEPGRPPAETVADLCERLSRQSASGAGAAGGGRHVARAGGMVELNSGSTTSESRGGGRRRRPDSGVGPAADRSGAAPSAAVHGAAAGTNGSAPSRSVPSNGAASSGSPNGASPNGAAPNPANGEATSTPNGGSEATARAAAHGGLNSDAWREGNGGASSPIGEARGNGNGAATPGLNGVRPGVSDRARRIGPVTALNGTSPNLGAAPGPNGIAGLDGHVSGLNGAASGLGSPPPGLSGAVTPNDTAPGPSSAAPGRTGSCSRTAGIDRSAVARLSRLALRPPVALGTASNSTVSNSTVSNGTVSNGTGLNGTNGVHPYGAATERIELSALAATALAVRPEDTTPQATTHTTDTTPRATTHSASAPVPDSGTTAAASSPDPAAANPVRKPAPTAELSFAELLAGALAAYRDG